MSNSITLKDVNGNNIYPEIDASTLSGTIAENDNGFVIGDDVYTALGDKLDNSFSSNFYPMTGNPSGFLTEHQDLSDYATKTYVNDELSKVGHYHSASATVTHNGNNYTITLSSNNSYVVLDNGTVTGGQSLNITIVPPTLEQDELLDCMVQFRPVGGQSTTGHTVSIAGFTQVGIRAINDVHLNYIINGETAQIRLLGKTYNIL